VLTFTPKEANLEDYLRDRVEAMGGRCLKFVSPGTAGVSDRLIILPNLAPAFLELKRLGEEPTPLQLKFMRDMRKLGQVADWAYTQEGVERILWRVMDRG
jgi:hypothetical protein